MTTLAGGTPVRAMLLGSAGALACALSACAPVVVWHGHTPDRTTSVQVLRHRGSDYVQVDGVNRGRFDGIAISSLVISPDSRRIAYAARRGSRWSVVLDDTPGRTWSGIGEIVFTPDSHSIVYSAQRGRDWFVIRNDVEEGPPFDAILARSITVSRTGRVAWAGTRGDSVHVVIDGTPGAGWDGVAGIRFDPGGTHAGFIGRRAGSQFVVIDGRTHGPYEAVADFAWLDDGIAALVRRGGAWSAITGAVQHGPYRAVGALRTVGDSWAFLARTADSDRIIEPAGAGPVFQAILPGSLQLHPVTRRTAYIARVPAGMIAVVAGRAGPPATQVRSLAFSADGERFGYIARRDGLDHVIIDHAEHATAATITDHVFDACSRPAWVARDHAGSTIHFGQQAYRYDIVVEQTFVAGDAGADWAAVVGSNGSRQLEIVVNGTPAGRRFDWNELAAALGRRTEHHVTDQAERTVRAWMAAELRLHAPAPTPCPTTSR